MRRALRSYDARDHLMSEALDDVALFDVVELVEADAALVARGDFADVVAEATQRIDPIRRDELAAPVDARSALDDPAVRHIAARDNVPAGAEDLADLCAAFDDFDLLRLQEA